MELETKRLILRPVEEGDALSLFPLINDADVARNLLTVPYPYHEGSYVPWIIEAQAAMACKERYELSIVLKTHEKPIGCCGISDISWNHRRAEIGYWLGKPYWGQGYMTEAVRSLIRFGFEELKLERIYAYCLDTNNSSVRVLEKCGMTKEGFIRNGIKKGDEYLDLYLFGIIREDFKNAT